MVFGGSACIETFTELGEVWTAPAKNVQAFTFTETTGDLLVSLPEPRAAAMLLGGAPQPPPVAQEFGPANAFKPPQFLRSRRHCFDAAPGVVVLRFAILIRSRSMVGVPPQHPGTNLGAQAAPISLEGARRRPARREARRRFLEREAPPGARHQRRECPPASPPVRPAAFLPKAATLLDAAPRPQIPAPPSCALELRMRPARRRPNSPKDASIPHRLRKPTERAACSPGEKQTTWSISFPCRIPTLPLVSQ